VTFRPGGGKVKVCEFCQTVVLRGEAKLESLFKVADLVDTESPLRLGLQGADSGTPFTVVGRLQRQASASQWDEWYLLFDDGRAGWLSESEGAWHLMVPAASPPPPNAHQLQPLDTFTLGSQRFVVEEVAQASTVSAQGELPQFEIQHTFVDATGPKGVFASLDLSGSGEAFVGRRVTLAQLGFSPGDLEPQPRHDALSAARCTQCNGPLELKAPDAAKRVACPYCGALLEVSHGRLAFLQLLEKPPVAPFVPLGRRGRLNNIEWTVLAFLVRSCTVGGNRYPWDEYLLWNHEHGFSWLMCSNNHWTHLTPIAAGEVSLRPAGATYQQQPYRWFQSVTAVTDFVVGECYWQVAVGEVAYAKEYVAPPLSLNVDQTEAEASLTVGHYLSPEVVRQAFELPELPPPLGVAPAQPNPHRDSALELTKWSAIWFACLLVLVGAFSALGDTSTLVRQSFRVAEGAASSSPEAQGFTDMFRIEKKVPLEIRVDAPSLNNNWLGVSVDVVNVQTGEVVAVYAEPSRYAGVDEGESWSEGSQSVVQSADAVDPGDYVARATPSFETGRASDYELTIRADDGPGFFWPMMVLLGLIAIPLVVFLRSNAFETQRWADAEAQPVQNESRDDDE
jgi:hypothetical protein